MSRYLLIAVLFLSQIVGAQNWLTDFNEGNIKHKKWRTDSCESILRFGDRTRIRT